MKIKIRKDIISKIGDASVRLCAGDVIDVSAEDADHLVRGGYADQLQDAPAAVKVTEKQYVKPSLK